jgi:hypothetical protein
MGVNGGKERGWHRDYICISQMPLHICKKKHQKQRKRASANCHKPPFFVHKQQHVKQVKKQGKSLCQTQKENGTHKHNDQKPTKRQNGSQNGIKTTKDAEATSMKICKHDKFGKREKFRKKNNETKYKTTAKNNASK